MKDYGTGEKEGKSDLGIGLSGERMPIPPKGGTGESGGEMAFAPKTSIFDEEKKEEVYVTESKLVVSRTIPKNVADRIGIEDKDEETTIDIHKFVTEPAMVEVTYGSKKMIAKFEPVEVRVSVRMPCYKEEIQDCYQFISGIVTDIMNKEFDVINKSLDAKEKGVVYGKEETEGTAGGAKKEWY